MFHATGKIERIIEELGLGYIRVTKMAPVFFTTTTGCVNTHFSNLRVNDKVYVEYQETERGLLATRIVAVIDKSHDKLQNEAEYPA